jgi:hypothetical protein
VSFAELPTIHGGQTRALPLEAPYQPPACTERRKPEPPDSGRFLRWIVPATVVPVSLPLVFDYFDDSIDREWTVVTFGCSCPALDGTYRTFNANHFNLGVWVFVFLIGAVFSLYCV